MLRPKKLCCTKSTFWEITSFSPTIYSRAIALGANARSIKAHCKRYVGLQEGLSWVDFSAATKSHMASGPAVSMPQRLCCISNAGIGSVEKGPRCATSRSEKCTWGSVDHPQNPTIDVFYHIPGALLPLALSHESYPLSTTLCPSGSHFTGICISLLFRYSASNLVRSVAQDWQRWT